MKTPNVVSQKGVSWAFNWSISLVLSATQSWWRLLTDRFKTFVDTVHKEGKPQKVIVKEAGCSQDAVSNQI